jgi:hypothetical protein
VVIPEIGRAPIAEDHWRDTSVKGKETLKRVPVRANCITASKGD